MNSFREFISINLQFFVNKFHQSFITIQFFCITDKFLFNLLLLFLNTDMFNRVYMLYEIQRV